MNLEEEHKHLARNNIPFYFHYRILCTNSLRNLELKDHRLWGLRDENETKIPLVLAFVVWANYFTSEPHFLNEVNSRADLLFCIHILNICYVHCILYLNPQNNIMIYFTPIYRGRHWNSEMLSTSTFTWLVNGYEPKWSWFQSLCVYPLYLLLPHF